MWRRIRNGHTNLRQARGFGSIPIATIIVCLATSTVSASETVGIAKVIDGDSLSIGDVEIRLHGIDAPEFQQTCTIGEKPWACGRSATNALRQMVAKESVRCMWTMRDRYGRALATCIVNGANLNAKLVATGMALAYTRYSDRYIAEQNAAQNAQLGVWRSEFQAPWQWRTRFKQPVQP